MKEYESKKREVKSCDEICKAVRGTAVLLDKKQKQFFASWKYHVNFTPQGSGELIFDTSLFNEYTIVVNNIGMASIEAYLVGYPEIYNYGTMDTGSVRTIEPNTQSMFAGRILINYTGICMNGIPNDEVIVYLQAHYVI